MVALTADRNTSAVAFLKRVVVGLDDIEGPDGARMPYSDALRDQVIALPFVRAPMVRGYFDAVYPARLGN